ncbi:Aquaporin [Frankliniella fusca]|uniref:Aquaporin n=1 Tax=Frankliniella fusca TaxID=407009 RepID=A0AAE1HQG7_9NEOP|nr:Aquaporin [Frankliniella fusca]
MEALTNSWRALVAEVTGSTFLVFCGSIMFSSPDTLDELKHRMFLASLGDVGLRFGMTLATLAVALGPVSGAHFNPVVSMSALINGRIEWQPCLLYVAAQLLGSLMGAAMAWGLGGSGVTLPSGMHNGSIKALCIEMLITGLLVLVFLGASDPERGDALKDLGGVAVGLALAVGHWVGVYFVGPPVGAAISAVVYKFVFSGAKEGGGF